MLVVNLFGAAGAGKSTLALLVAGILKTEYPHLTTECPDEFPKLLVYDEAHKAFGCQIYIAGRQQWQVARCAGHADIVVCDSPVLLSAVYGADTGQNLPEAFTEVCKHYHHTYPSLNYFVTRKHPFEARARLHTEGDEDRIGTAIRRVLDFVDYEEAHSTWEDARRIAFDAAILATEQKAKK